VVIHRFQALLQGAPLSPDAFVFSTSPDGLTPYAPRAISQRYRKLALKLSLDPPPGLFSGVCRDSRSAL